MVKPASHAQTERKPMGQKRKQTRVFKYLVYALGLAVEIHPNRPTAVYYTVKTKQTTILTRKLENHSLLLMNVFVLCY